MAGKTVRIECTGTDEKPVEELVDFQDGLKKITRENLDKLKGAILKYGFSAPIFVWEHEGKSYMLDGHQRVKALMALREEGYEIPPAPVVYVEAKDEKEARHKLLTIVSQYGIVQNKGFSEWTEGLDLQEVFAEVRIPEVNLSTIDAEKPEMEFSEELLESHNYVVLYFDNEVDWLQAQTVLGIKTVKDRHPRLSRRGIGRVVRGAEVIARIK